MKERDDIFAQVKRAAYEIIETKGATNFAIALAAIRIVGAIFRDENNVLTVSTLLDDYYGISDVCLSIAVRVNRHGVFWQLRLTMNQSEAENLRASAGVIKELIQCAKCP